jgi:zinc transport system substrate-binding protein
MNRIFLFFLFGFTCLCGCQPEKHASEALPVIAVTVEPHAFLVQKIGGHRFRVEVLVPAGKEPETYQTTPDKIAALSHASVFFRTGIPIEELLIPKLKSFNTDLKVIDLRDGIPLRKMELHHHLDDGDGEDHNEGTDPHIWFAPSLLKIESSTILKTLTALDPVGSAEYQANYDQFLTELEAVRLELTDILVPVKGKTVFVFHPTYGYFCDEFDLQQQAVEFEGKSPRPQQLAALIAEVKKSKESPKIFVQPEFNQSPAMAVAEATGGTVVVHSALAPDVLESMKRFARELVRK